MPAYASRVVTEGQAHCSRCDTMKDHNDFSKSKSSKYGFCYWCKTCAAESARKHHSSRIKANDTEYRRSKRNTSLKRKYGLTLKEYEEKLEAQGNICVICEVKLLSSGQGTHLDHCHKSGDLRAFLCTNCNRGLGHFQDSTDLLLKAADYLETHKSSVD